ncbi:MAG: exopolyphosphatase [Alphaproteobacteria bacterium]
MSDVALTAGRIESAVVDIGSNSVRLVMYAAPARAPMPVFNQKHICQLGRGIAATGKLWPKGKAKALSAARQFRRLLQAAGPRTVHVIATAALRDADDGQDFAQQLQDALGHPISIIDGEREATLAACGLLSGLPGYSGFVGDLGGGSLELVEIEEGEIGNRVTLPLGPLRLQEVDDLADTVKIKRYIDEALGQVDWLQRMQGQRFVAIGGAWRVLALYHIRTSAYPLEIIDGLSLSRSRADEICEDVAGMSFKQVKALNISTKRRCLTVPHAAQVMSRIARVLEPRRIMFSAAGLREGVLYDALPEQDRGDDPVLSILHGVAAEAGLTGAIPLLMDWLSPVFAESTAMLPRQMEAAICLSALCRNEHPSYRAQHGYARVLRMPIWGLNHPERVQLALAIFHRYGGDSRRSRTPLIHEALTSAQRRAAEALGNLLGAAYEMTGGMPSLVSHTRLDLTDRHLILYLPADWQMGLPREVKRECKRAARMMGRKLWIKQSDS